MYYDPNIPLTIDDPAYLDAPVYCTECDREVHCEDEIEFEIHDSCRKNIIDNLNKGL